MKTNIISTLTKIACLASLLTAVACAGTTSDEPGGAGRVSATCAQRFLLTTAATRSTRPTVTMRALSASTLSFDS